jgi:hypothetical protein
MEKECPVVAFLELIMNQVPQIIQVFKNKNPQKIIHRKSPLDRMPIDIFGLVQHSFIHNLLFY